MVHFRIGQNFGFIRLPHAARDCDTGARHPNLPRRVTVRAVAELPHGIG
jgi:hypothetical protein